MRVGMSLAAVFATALAGCDTVTTVPGGTAPFVKDDPVKWEYKATHAVNWQELAERSVAQLPAWTEKPPVFVDPDVEAPFSTVYKQYLEEALLAANYPVVQDRALAHMVVDFDIKPLVYPEIVTGGPDTPAEIIVSTRVANEGRIHALRTEAIYVKPADLHYYLSDEGLPVATLPAHAVTR